ncbi:hypothetical protein BVY04_02385 [bacterium M21]|nr:hypothetical protein BVY04_02385 [bacterium M21]
MLTTRLIMKLLFLCLLWAVDAGSLSGGAAEPYDISQETYETKVVWKAPYSPKSGSGYFYPSRYLRPWNTPITSYKDSTYVVYVDPHGRPKVVEISGTGTVEEYLEQMDYISAPDDHHAFSIGVDEKGYIHITGNMHNGIHYNYVPDRYNTETAEIMYWRSKHPEDVSSMAFCGWRGAGEEGVAMKGHGPTYYSFFNDHEGRLFWSARCKTKTKNSITMSRFNTDTMTWTELGGADDLSSVPCLMHENEAQGGSGSYVLTRMCRGGATDAKNRIHVAANLLNTTSVEGANGYVTSDTVYLRSDDFGESFVRANGVQVELPARVEAGPSQGDVIVNDYRWLNSDATIAVDRNNDPSVVVRKKGVTGGTSFLMSWSSAQQQWKTHDIPFVAGFIFNDSMGTMMLRRGGAITRFWSWESTHKTCGDPGIPDKRYMQLTGNLQGLKSGSGDVLQVVRVIVHRPKAPEIVVEGDGTSIACGAEQVSTADDTDFGLVAVGESVTKTYTIRNSGTTDLRLFTVRTRGQGFSVDLQPGTTTLAPGAETSFSITFTQAIDTATNGVVSFGNNDPDESRFVFAVRANGGTNNIAPVAKDDEYGVDVNQVLTVSAPGLLDNDTDEDHDTLTVLKQTDPANGTVTLNVDGSFTYTPNLDFSGTDSFTYLVNDGTVDSNIATVTIAVNKTPFPEGDGVGFVQLHFWWGIAGSSVSDLTSDADYPNTPDYVDNDWSRLFGGSPNWGDNFGRRIFGFLHPPVTAEYTFRIYGKNACELWISTDSDPANKQKVAFVSDSGVNPEDWTREVSQEGKMQLTAGQVYFVELLQKGGTGSDHLATGWETATHAFVEIDSQYLSPTLPTLQVSGNGVVIAHGDTIPSSADDTFFGSVTVGQAKVVTYTITNSGHSSITLNEPTSTDDASFAVGALSSTTIAPNSSATFDVTFTPATTDSQAATIAFTSADGFASDSRIRTEFSFAVRGNANPVVKVSGNNTEIVNGDDTPSILDATDFGNLNAGESKTIVYTIENKGATTLETGYIFVSRDTDFRVTTRQSPTDIAPGGSTTFEVTFTPRVPSAQTTTVSFATNDADENLFSFDINGSLTTPAIITDTGDVLITEGADATFQVKLDSQPSSDVEVNVSQVLGDGDVRVSAGTALSFTPTDWNTYQTVTLSAGEDSDAVDGNAVFSCKALGITAAVVTATEQDNDFTLIVTDNGGGSTTPSDSIVVPSDAPTHAVAATADASYYFDQWVVISGSATFTDIYATTADVTLTGDAEILARFQSSIPGPAIVTDMTTVDVGEGGAATFQVKLAEAPAADVQVTVQRTSGDDDITLLSGGSLTFTTTNWGDYQAVTLSAAEDDADTTNGTATISCTSAGAVGTSVDANELDDDFTLTLINDGNGTTTPAAPTIVDGDNAPYAIDATPNTGHEFFEWVIVSGTATIASATTAATTAEMTGDVTLQATFTALAGTPAIVTDLSTVSISEGETAIFQVKLSDRPGSDVTVAVAHVAGDADITVDSGQSLTFTTGNWGTYQSVTLAAISDGDDIHGSAVIRCSSTGATAREVTVAEIDDEAAVAPHGGGSDDGGSGCGCAMGGSGMSFALPLLMSLLFVMLFRRHVRKDNN